MISISTASADIDGSVVFDEDQASELTKHSSRLSRLPTLDGGVVVNDYGFVDGDRIIQIFSKILSTEKQSIIRHIKTNHTEIVISTNDGVYFGHIKTISYDNGILALTLYIENKDS